mgnify:CR=1 FL=1|jgi:hypothetical protein
MRMLQENKLNQIEKDKKRERDRQEDVRMQK